MLNFNNTLTSKIISLTIAVSFLMTDISYVGAYQQGSLRVPMRDGRTLERVRKEMKRQQSVAQSPAAATENATFLHTAISMIVGRYETKYLNRDGRVLMNTPHGAYGPSHENDIEKILDAAKLGPDVIFGDLGSGLGHLLFRAVARARGAKRVFGWEIDGALFNDSCEIRDELRRYPEFANADIGIKHQSYLEGGSGIEECDVLYWYYNQGPYDGGLRNDEKLQEELMNRKFKPCARIIVYGGGPWHNTFRLIEEKHDATLVYRIYDLNSFGYTTDASYPGGEFYHTSWAHVQDVGLGENYDPNDMIIWYEKKKGNPPKKVDKLLINTLRSDAVKTGTGVLVKLEESWFYAFYINKQKVLISEDIIKAIGQEKIIGILEMAVTKADFKATKDKLPLIISSLLQSPRMFEDHNQNGFIGINQAFLGLYRQYEWDVETKLYIGILLQVGLEHELRHEKGETDEDKLTEIDVRRIVELCKVHKVDPGKFTEFLKKEKIVDEEFERRIKIKSTPAVAPKLGETLRAAGAARENI